MDFYRGDEDDDYRRPGPSPLTLLKVLGLFFVAFLGPAILVGVITFIIFMRTLRWKPQVTIIPVTILFVILALFSSGPLSQLSLITDLNGFSENWAAITGGFIYLSIMFGLIIGYGIILYKAFDLKRNPEYVYIKGWAYGFEYTPTPLDKRRKAKNIESLQSGDEFDYDRSPVGVLDAPVQNADLEGSLDRKNSNRASIVYRHYTEAMAHTLITGKTGSGKALHIDTEIRTKEKGWTTIGEVVIGDTLYDENGNHTKLTAIYQPMTIDHYAITFGSGEVVKACGDHLWNIGDVMENNTVSTRDLLSNYSSDTEYTIEHFVDGLLVVHDMLKIERILDEPADYLCFTVDAPSHLFLITRGYIPTHNTVTMLSLIQNDILAGNPLCVIDFKKSPDLIYFLSKWAEESGREFYHFLSGKPGSYKNPYNEEQSTYDPLSTGGPTAKADMILNLRTWDTASEVFKKRTQDVLVSLFFLLDRTPRDKAPEIEWDNGGLAQFVSALDLNNFKKMIELMAMDMQAGKLSSGDVRRYTTLVDLYKELSSKSKSDLKAQIVELLSIARTLIVSNYGDWLATGTSGSHINLMDIATSKDGPIVLFSFNQQEEPEFAQYIGSIVMSDLSRVSALKNAQGDQTNFGVYIDEFQTLDPGTVKDNLEKARSSKMYITLSLQSLDQIVSSAASQGEAMANSIIDTCANFIFHDGSGYDTAEKMSKIIGKSQRYIYKATSKSDNRLIKFRLLSVDKAMVGQEIKEDWLVPPSEFQSLESPAASNDYKATAYVINKSSDDRRFKRGGGALARKVHVVVASETAAGVPSDFKQQILVTQDDELDFADIQSTVLLDYEEGISVATEDDLNSGDWSIESIDVDVYEDVDEDLDSDSLKPVDNDNKENTSLQGETLELPTLDITNTSEPFDDIQDNSINHKEADSINVAEKAKPAESTNNISEDNTKSQLDIFKQLSAKKPSKPKAVKKKAVEDKSTDIKLPGLD